MAFLGGKYLHPEQVITGNVQTFRARDAATGRPVFVHRIAETTQPQQAALLKLLLSCLYRSPTVKELVLDVREEGDFCFVVTESVPQCLLLREWLQFESDRSDPGAKPAVGGTPLRSGSEAPRTPQVAAATQRSEPQPPVLKPSRPAEVRPEPGEFTRMFQALDPSKADTVSQKMPAPVQSPVRSVPPPDESGKVHKRAEPTEKPGVTEPGATTSTGAFTRLFQTPLQTPPSQASKDMSVSSLGTVARPPVPTSGQPEVADAHSAPGEFTRLFETPAQRPASGPPAPRPVSSGPAVPNPKPGPGEFTRFFGGGSPAPNQEGFVAPAVQRPSSSQNIAAPSQSSGEFTRLFSGDSPRPVAPAATAPSYAVTSTPAESFRQPNTAGPAGTTGEFTRIFGGGTERSSSLRAPQSSGGYTQLFGTNDPTPVPPPAQPALGSRPNVSPLNEPGPSLQPPRPVPQGPSEFTRVVMGPAAPPAESAPAPAANLPIALPAATVPPVASAIPGVHVPAAPHVPSIPTAPYPAVQAASTPAPQLGKKPNKRLLLLLLILFVLAVALVILIGVTAK